MMIIAEAGINHNGKLELAKKLVDAAVYADADAIKFQTFWDIYRLKNFEFSTKQWIELKRYCDKRDILFLSTPHSFKAIHFINKLVPIHKIASSYLGLPNFLMEVADKRKPILLSTGSMIREDGMATIEEVKCALRYLDYRNVTLMHCISKYPCYNIHREREEELSKLGCKVGLSDHTTNIIYNKKYPYLEKHLMLENGLCPDENVSINPNQFKEMVECLRSL
jgi:N,N'-diacetyllegionaminate synthase